MEALRTVGSRIGKKEGGLALTDPVVQEGLREFWSLGWKKDESRGEPAPPHIVKMTGKRTVYPWYISPEGESFRGLKAAVLHAVATLPPVREPSPTALRIVRALEKDPELLAEVRTLLGKRPT